MRLLSEAEMGAVAGGLLSHRAPPHDDPTNPGFRNPWGEARFGDDSEDDNGCPQETEKDKREAETEELNQRVRNNTVTAIEVCGPDNIQSVTDKGFACQPRGS